MVGARKRWRRAACFPPGRSRYKGREVGGGRATRQPGQVRKEAALTSAVRVARQPPAIPHPRIELPVSERPSEQSDMSTSEALSQSEPGIAPGGAVPGEGS